MAAAVNREMSAFLISAVVMSLAVLVDFRKAYSPPPAMAASTIEFARP